MENVLTKGRHKVLPALGQFPGTGLSLNRVSWDNGEVGKEDGFCRFVLVSIIGVVAAPALVVLIVVTRCPSAITARKL